MSVAYKLVQWTPHKIRYDAIVAVSVVLIVLSYVVVGHLAPATRQVSDEILIMRALGFCAILMLHAILCIGPAARLDRRFLPLLFNRRHLGVATFFVALAHAAIAVGYYHGFGAVSPLVSLLTSNTQYRSVSAFPFETLGLFALVILFLLAATSHDFWLKNLTPVVWKWLHMSVYLAWAALLMHVALGAMLNDAGFVKLVLLAIGAVTVTTLHLLAGRRAIRDDRAVHDTRSSDKWVDVAAVSELRDGQGKVVQLGLDHRVALFRHGDLLSALSNVCAHQGGPLGEGRIVDGCVTCPWHGYQYRPHDGCSPPPFTEKIPTYQLRVEAGRVLVNPEPLAPGTAIEPARVQGDGAVASPSQARSIENDEAFYVGYLPLPAALRVWLASVVGAMVVAAIAMSVVISSTARDPGPAVWNDGELSTFTGTLTCDPWPTLWVSSAEHTSQTVRPMLIIEEGKHGARQELSAFDGRTVTLRGHTLTRGELRMFELSDEPDAVKPSESSVAGSSVLIRTDKGTVTLTGEIIDPKCFSGAMKPGDGKGHKACATLCIRGGIPPMLAVWDGAGEPTLWLLTDAQGRAFTEQSLEELLPFVGDFVKVQGQAFLTGNLRQLKIDPREIVRR